MKPLHLPVAAAALAALSLTACQSQTDYALGPDPQSCLRAHQISSYSFINDETLLVEAGINRYFQLDLFAPCPTFDWTRSIGFEVGDRVARTTMVCPSAPERISVLMPVGRSVLRCPVKELRALTPAEVAALPVGLRP